MNGRILSVHYLRGIAALLVVFFHFRSFLDNVYVQKDLGNILFGSGAFGVDLFFMISGFIISLSTERTSSVSVFITRRFFRIYPAFIIVFIFGSLTVYSSYSIHELVRSMFFIHKDYTQQAPGFGFNILGPAWTLSYEIYFYILFVIAMGVSHKHRTLITSLMLAAPVFILQLYYNDSISLSAKTSPDIQTGSPLYPFIKFCSSPILLEFIFGMLIFEIQKVITKRASKQYAMLIMLSSIGVFLTLYFSGYGRSFGLTGFGAWSLILITGVMFYDKSVGFRNIPALNFLGDISYSIYLSHYVVIKALEAYRPEWWVSIDGISRFLAATTSCVIVAFLLFKFIETPFLKLGKVVESIIKNKRSPEIKV